jgi:hypothetical protein
VAAGPPTTARPLQAADNRGSPIDSEVRVAMSPWRAGACMWRGARNRERLAGAFKSVRMMLSACRFSRGGSEATQDNRTDERHGDTAVDGRGHPEMTRYSAIPVNVRPARYHACPS